MQISNKALAYNECSQNNHPLSDSNLFCEIFFQLGIKELGCLASVCRKYNLIQQHDWFWLRLFKSQSGFDFINPTSDKSIKACLKEQNPQLFFTKDNLSEKSCIDIARFAMSYFSPKSYISFIQKHPTSDGLNIDTFIYRKGDKIKLHISEFDPSSYFPPVDYHTKIKPIIDDRQRLFYHCFEKDEYD